MHAAASADPPLHSTGHLLVRSASSRGANGASPSLGQTMTMLRPFHSNETQCAAERRLKAERTSYSSSKAGFMGQLRHQRSVQQRLQSMAPHAEPVSPEAAMRDLERARLDLERGDGSWPMLPGSAPPPLLCRQAQYQKVSAFGPGHRGDRCHGSTGFAGGKPFSKGSRRKRPVHVMSMGQEDPVLIDFCEEPEDPRVYLPAHRIGDLLPETASQSSAQTLPPKLNAARSAKVGLSKSMPSLHIAGTRRLPLRPLRGGGLVNGVSLGGSGYGSAKGASSAKPMSRQHEEIARPLSQNYDDQIYDDNVFPEAPSPKDFPDDEGGDDDLLEDYSDW